MKFKNISTGECVNVCNIKMLQGRIFFSVRGKGCGQRFLNRNVCLVKDEDAPTGTWLKVADGWELAEDEPKAQKTPKAATPTPKKKKASNKKSTDVPDAAQVYADSHVADDSVTIVNDSDSADPKVNDMVAAANDLNYGVDADVLRKELEAKYGAMGGDIFDAAIKLAGYVPKSAAVDETQVRKICDEYMKKANVATIHRDVVVHAPKGDFKVDGATAKNFDIYCNLVSAGKPLYMYGPAGSGKSYTAKQIAKALGYDYYETSQAMFAHELKGYGDAGGRFVETAFYRAFANGGVFFLDEVDASAPEALVVLNNAIANGRFDFPVIGNIDAHPDFRVIAAGNTRMTGATLAYVARQMQDTSFKNRFFFEIVTYDYNVFMQLTGNDEEIVNFGADLRRAARLTGINQLFSYRQAMDLANLLECCRNNEAHLLRGSVLQEKELDDCVNLYEHLQNKSNFWAKAMAKCIEEMRNEEVW